MRFFVPSLRIIVYLLAHGFNMHSQCRVRQIRVPLRKSEVCHSTAVPSPSQVAHFFTQHSCQHYSPRIFRPNLAWQRSIVWFGLINAYGFSLGQFSLAIASCLSIGNRDTSRRQCGLEIIYSARRRFMATALTLYVN